MSRTALSILICSILGGLTLSCASARQNPNLPNLISESEYDSLIDTYTANKKVYDGLYQTVDFYGTLVNSKVAHAQLDQNARIYQWNQEQFSNKKSEVETKLSKQTEIFLSFFVPERKHDDLNKPKTLWKIFLDAGGKRYEGRAEKIKTILADVQSLYPHHTRFYTPYRIIFSVPTSMIENGESKLTLTGPVGSASIDFPALQ